MSDPAWLTHLVDQRMALIEQVLEHVPPSAWPMVVANPLTEPPEGATPEEFERWERTCDNCKRYCPHPVPFYTGHKQLRTKNGTLVLIMFGVCDNCKWDT